MVPGDLAAVAELDLAAFDTAAARAGHAPPEQRRHRLGLEYFRQKAPDLCLVARAGSEVLGYLFGHRWGATAWTGPIGVATEYMNHGIGTKLLVDFCQRAEVNEASVIGLETSIGHNVRLYERRGFKSRGLRLLTLKDLTTQPPRLRLRADGSGQAGDFRLVPWTSLSADAKKVRAAEVRRIGSLIVPGLDHTVEIAAVPEHRMGVSYLALNSQDELSGYAVVHLRSYRSADFNDAEPPLEPLVWILVGWPEAVQALISCCEAATADAGGNRLRLSCYSANPHAWVVAREAGYRLENAYVRLIYRGDYPGSADRPWGGVPLDYSSWLG